MNKKKQTTTSQPIPSPVYVNFGDCWFPIRGMQKFFGFLAYPPVPPHHPQARDVERLRNEFMGIIEAEAWRSYTEAGGNVEMARKVMSPAIVGKAWGARGKRAIEGQFNYGFKNRIAMRRMLAAMAALPKLVHGNIVKSIPKIANGKPQSVDEALHVLLDADMDANGPQWRTVDEFLAMGNTRHGRSTWYNQRFQNFKKLVWYESLPVLHLAIALCLTVRRYRPDLPVSASGYLLLKDPSWLCGALGYADTKIRPALHEFFPDFDPATAVQIIPVIPVSTPTFNPTLRY